MDPRQASVRAGGDGPPEPGRADAHSDADRRQAPSGLTLYRPYGLAALAGLLSILSFPGAGWWPLAFVSIVPLLIALEGTAPRRALLCGWIAGFTGNACGFYWLVHTVREFGDLPLPIAVLSYLLLAAGNGLSWGVFAALYRWVGKPAGARGAGAPPASSPKGEIEPRWWWAPVGWAAMEFGWWSVFPYYFGAGLYKVPLLMQGADVTSILGCSFLLLVINAALHQGWRAWRKRPNEWKRAAIAAGAFFAVWTGYGAIRWEMVSSTMAAAKPLRIGMVQSDIGAQTKRQGGPWILGTYQQMTRDLEAQGVDLILWPETSYTQVLYQGDASSYMVTGPIHTPIVFGAVMIRPGNFEYNAAVLADSSQKILASSYKIKMVPFGEYLPLGTRFPKLYELIPAISHLQPGPQPYPLALPDLRMGSLICYEDILPSYVRWVVNETRPNLLVNLTNDSWYGNSIEPTIHLALASFRAVEHRRGLARSTNTGRSALIDPLGRITLESGQWTKETLVGTLPWMPETRTPYDLFGDWLGWGCVAAFAGVAFGRWRAKRKRA